MEKLEVTYMPTEDLIPYANNAKKHPKWQIKQICKSIDQFGFCDPIAIDENNVVIEGHGRLLAAKEMGIEDVPVIHLDYFDEDAKKAYILVHNKLTMNTGFNLEQLQEELDSIETIDMGDFGFLDDDDDMGLPDFSEDIFKEDEPKHFDNPTDEFITPDDVYGCVFNWVCARFNIDSDLIVRPFVPDGDYENDVYDNDVVVLDNPPFSKINEIVDFYDAGGVNYFLFAPADVLFSIGQGSCHYIPVNVPIRYEGGAIVYTSFVTNICDEKVLVPHELYDMLMECYNKHTPKTIYPDAVITSTSFDDVLRAGKDFSIADDKCEHIYNLDVQNEYGECIHGTGFLLSNDVIHDIMDVKDESKYILEDKAIEDKWNKPECLKLSDREQQIVDSMY